MDLHSSPHARTPAMAWMLALAMLGAVIGKTFQALPSIVDGLRARGFTFASLDELL